MGKLSEPFYRDGCAHYLARLRALAQAEVIEVRRGRGGETEVKRSEGAALLAAASGAVVALDEGGRSLDTRALALWVNRLEVAGESRVSFLVGGAAGHNAETLKAAPYSLSLSPLTMPHELARLVLLEQLYRVESLRAGHPYHRG